MLRRNGPVVKSVESVLRLQGSLWWERFVKEVGGALCESSVIPFLVPRRNVWLTPAAGVPCSNADNIGERKTWT